MLEASGTKAARRNAAGFTLVELVVSTALGSLVMIGILTLFLWALRTASECRQYAWSQAEAVKSSQKIMTYLRNGMAIHNIDVSGNWVEISMPPTGRVSRVSYDASGVGTLLFVADVYAPAASTTTVATGVSKVMGMPVRNVFERSGSNTLRVAYRITRPMGEDVYPAEVDVGLALRNYEEP